MTANNSPPATPADIRFIGERLNEVLNRQDAFEERIAQSDKRTQRHFDVTVKTIRHDLMNLKPADREVVRQDIVRIQEFVRLPGA